jgi:hypothetical protein
MQNYQKLNQLECYKLPWRRNYARTTKKGVQGGQPLRGWMQGVEIMIFLVRLFLMYGCNVDDD